MLNPHSVVMAGLDPAIRVFVRGASVDDRDKPGHDGVWQ
jgi:hypothetical protein